MIDHLYTLKTSWYISPPWGNLQFAIRKSQFAININENWNSSLIEHHAYLVKNISSVLNESISNFSLIANCELRIANWYHATQHQIIGTGELVNLTAPKSAFVLGQKVILTSYGNDAKQRLILGINLVNNSWFYLVELVSPTLTQSPIISNRFSLVGEKSLMRVLK